MGIKELQIAHIRKHRSDKISNEIERRRSYRPEIRVDGHCAESGALRTGRERASFPFLHLPITQRDGRVACCCLVETDIVVDEEDSSGLSWESHHFGSPVE